ncbi:MAG: hypothetical protein JXR76_11650, partial [Deltaproteobacteria bacterium]|nr:hypothetical protein [Deltaproteobacteria bacterium]
ETARLQLHKPASHENMNAEAFERLIDDKIAQQEKQTAENMRCSEQTFLGMDAVLKQSHKDKPQSHEERRGLNPKFFAMDKWLRIDAIKRYKQFVSSYWEAS